MLESRGGIESSRGTRPTLYRGSSSTRVLVLAGRRVSPFGRHPVAGHLSAPSHPWSARQSPVPRQRPFAGQGSASPAYLADRPRDGFSQVCRLGILRGQRPSVVPYSPQRPGRSRPGYRHQFPASLRAPDSRWLFIGSSEHIYPNHRAADRFRGERCFPAISGTWGGQKI